jgi:hypothetical protein
MNYSVTDQSGNSYTHMWDVASAKTFDGGFRLSTTELPDALKTLPRGTFLKVDHAERTATVVKTAVLHEAITAESTVAKIKKGALLVATDVLGIGTKAVVVGAIDTSNAAYDSFTIDAGSLGALAKDSVLQTYGKASAGGVKGVYELSITTNATAGDKISINGIEFEFASVAGAGKVVVGASASASAANLDNVLEQELALTSVFDITYSGVKVIFTQKVAGVGAIPTLVVTLGESNGTLAAAIEQETAGVAADSYPVNPDGLCPVDVEIDAEPTVSVMFRADGIVETTLPQAVTPAIRAALPFCQFLNI